MGTTGQQSTKEIHTHYSAHNGSFFKFKLFLPVVLEPTDEKEICIIGWVLKLELQN